MEISSSTPSCTTPTSVATRISLRRPVSCHLRLINPLALHQGALLRCTRHVVLSASAIWSHLEAQLADATLQFIKLLDQLHEFFERCFSINSAELLQLNHKTHRFARQTSSVKPGQSHGRNNHIAPLHGGVHIFTIFGVFRLRQNNLSCRSRGRRAFRSCNNLSVGRTCSNFPRSQKMSTDLPRFRRGGGSLLLPALSVSNHWRPYLLLCQQS